MDQWEKYDVEPLLDIADSTNAPDENGEWEGVMKDVAIALGWRPRLPSVVSVGLKIAPATGRKA